MKHLETGKDKIQKICDVIRKETLDPAKQEAREIIENAHLQAAEILKDAEAKAAVLKKQTDEELEEKKRVFHSSLNLACRQALETLKQKIERQLFAPELAQVVVHEMGKPELVAELIRSFMRSLEEQGIEEDFEVVIPREISPRSISALVTAKVLERLKGGGVEVGDFGGGVRLRMESRSITIDITDAVVRELIAAYIRRDLRDLIFSV